MENKKPKAEQSGHPDAYLIELEKQKTRRSRNMYLFFGTIILASIIALYFMLGSGGKGGIDVSIKEGTFKFNVDKPIVEQAKTETKTYQTQEGKAIDYTTGRISKELITDFKKVETSYSPDRFVGENLINDKAGYIISCTNPEL